MGIIRNILTEIGKTFRRGTSVLMEQRTMGIFDGFSTDCRQYADLIWLNICELLTDIIEDVDVTMEDAQTAKPDTLYKFSAFRAFIFAWGKVVLQQVFDHGFVTIAWNGSRFWVMDAAEYRTRMDNGKTIVEPVAAGVDVYVMRSPIYISRGKSDLALCRPFLQFLDDVLNGSATVSKRLGAVVVASPKNLTSAPTATVLTKEQKAQLEKEMREDYGALSNQSNIMLLPREMSWQTINLAGLDLKMAEKAKMAILAIADRIKVPANQIAIIDANSSKQLSNGSELRAGDAAKYKSFRRLFERTFVQMSLDMGLRVAYTIQGEPLEASAEPQPATNE